MSGYDNHQTKKSVQRAHRNQQNTISQKRAFSQRLAEQIMRHAVVDAHNDFMQALVDIITDKIDRLANDFPFNFDELKKLRDSIIFEASKILMLKEEGVKQHGGIQELLQSGTIDYFANSYFNNEGWKLSEILKAYNSKNPDDKNGFEEIFTFLFQQTMESGQTYETRTRTEHKRSRSESDSD